MNEHSLRWRGNHEVLTGLCNHSELFDHLDLFLSFFGFQKCKSMGKELFVRVETGAVRNAVVVLFDRIGAQYKIGTDRRSGVPFRSRYHRQEQTKRSFLYYTSCTKDFAINLRILHNSTEIDAPIFPLGAFTVQQADLNC